MLLIAEVDAALARLVSALAPARRPRMARRDADSCPKVNLSECKVVRNRRSMIYGLYYSIGASTSVFYL